MTNVIFDIWQAEKFYAVIAYNRFVLENGLRVLVHEDKSTPLVAVNVLYNVGARDEDPQKTGMAHLFEHLMFNGSATVPDFDEIIQQAGGENNAFTNNDITNFYEILPADNLEVAFWAESDRMHQLSFDERSLDVQRKVVIEEFNETCLNQPYGDVWHYIADMAYKVHPYRWPTIGKIPEHVAKTTLEDVKAFYQRHYCPNNAILVVTGNAGAEQVKYFAEKWFGTIPAGDLPARALPQEPPQEKLQQRVNQANVPVDALYLAFHAPSRTAFDYYVADLLSDLLSNGTSARLYRRLLKEQQLFAQIDCYLTGSIDPGLLIIEGQPAAGVNLEKAEAAIWKELELLQNEPVSERELQKWKNKTESQIAFADLSIVNRAINLAFFELLGNPDLINEEANIYHRVTVADIQRLSRRLFTQANCSELYYRAAERMTTVPATEVPVPSAEFGPGAPL